MDPRSTRTGRSATPRRLFLGLLLIGLVFAATLHPVDHDHGEVECSLCKLSLDDDLADLVPVGPPTPFRLARGLAPAEPALAPQAQPRKTRGPPASGPIRPL